MDEIRKGIIRIEDDALNDGLNSKSDGLNISDNQPNTIDRILNEGLNEGINEGINKSLVDIINILKKEQGLNAIVISSRLKKGHSTVERYLSILREKKIVEYRGARKTGGYYLTEQAT
ncbi:MAG: hypothetical protein LBR18_06300 [Tannerella sp.]|nr:hypothetical protein [Tannerella sp.]